MIATLFMVLKHIFKHRFSEATKFIAKLAIILSMVICGCKTAKEWAMESVGMQ